MRSSLILLTIGISVATAGCGGDRNGKQAELERRYFEAASEAERQQQWQRRQEMQQTQPEQMMQPGQAQPAEVAQPAGEPQYQWSRVHPDLRQISDGYSTEVRHIVTDPQTLQKSQHALRLLAHGVQKIPVEKDDMAESLVNAANEIREKADELEAEQWDERGRKKEREIVKASLKDAAKAMKKLVDDGPYDAPDIIAAVERFDRSVDAIAESDMVWTPGSTAYRALRESSDALRAFVVAIAGGRVDAPDVLHPAQR